MTNRERLIELVNQVRGDEIALADYEVDVLVDHLLANGVIAPPCKVGDIVYAEYSGTNEIEYYVVDEVTHLGSDWFNLEAHLENEDGYTVDTIHFVAGQIGKTVFLTKEEAEQALKEREWR